MNGARILVKIDLTDLKLVANLLITGNTSLAAIEAGATAWIGKFR